jgi:hypothetical protein
VNVQPIQAPPTSEEARERSVSLLDALLDFLCALLGPNGMQALVAGRVLRAQRKFMGEIR